MEDKYIEFLKKTEIYDKEALDYLKDNTKVVDYSEETSNLIGTYPQVDDNNILKGVNICVPKMTNDITVGMNIHNYVSALMLYRNINKEFKNDKYEDLMGTYYELAYLKDNEQEDYFNMYLENIKEENNHLTMLLNVFDKDNKKSVNQR